MHDWKPKMQTVVEHFAERLVKAKAGELA